MSGVAAMAVLVAGIAVALLLRPEPLPHADTVRFTIGPPEGGSFAGGVLAPFPAISPNGRHVTFVAQRDGQQPALWLQSLESLQPSELPGTALLTTLQYQVHPFWSFDSRHVAYFSGGSLRKIDITGGPSANHNRRSRR
jgi:hypothetical protein